MVEILLFLATRCDFLFFAGGFRIVDSRVSESFGDALVVLESSSTRLRFARDRGQLLMEFQPTSGKPREWFSLGLLRGILLGGRGGSEVLNDDWAQFFGRSLAELEARFSDPARLDATLEALRKQARLRAKELFG